MYTPEFENLILGGMEWEEYQALLREMAREEAEFYSDPEYKAWSDGLDANIDIDQMALYYGE
jgi:hypothetical protein